MTDLTPREIVSELDRFIIGQKEAKRAVAVDLDDAAVPAVRLFHRLVDRQRVEKFVGDDDRRTGGDIVERVDPIFFSDPMTAAMKALGLT